MVVAIRLELQCRDRDVQPPDSRLHRHRTVGLIGIVELLWIGHVRGSWRGDQFLDGRWDYSGAEIFPLNDVLAHQRAIGILTSLHRPALDARLEHRFWQGRGRQRLRQSRTDDASGLLDLRRHGTADNWQSSHVCDGTAGYGWSRGLAARCARSRHRRPWSGAPE